MGNGLQVHRQQPRQLLQSLDDALETGLCAEDPRLRELSQQVTEAVDELGTRHDWHLIAGLRQKESLLLLEAGLVEQALQAAREAWTRVEGRLSGSMQSLVLTQLAACYEARQDLRAAVRACRRAEALVVAECGDALPQTLAVRAQLVRLLRKSGRDAALPQKRLDRTARALRQEAVTPRQRARVEPMIARFIDCEEPPTWAWLYQRRWHTP